MPTANKSQSHEDKFQKVLISTAFYAPAFRGGGPIQTLKALINAAPDQFSTQVICSNHDLGTSEPLTNHPNQWIELDNASVYYTQGGVKSRISAFRQSSDASIIYLNSLFSPRFSILPLVLKQFGFWRSATILIAPRGELDPGVLVYKAFKKRIFISLFRLFGIHKRVLWHASTQSECTHIKRLFGNVTVMTKENETALPERAVTRTQRDDGPFRLLFASRLVENKGLHILLESLIKIRVPIELSIVGAFEDSEYESVCKDLVHKMQDEISITFHGAQPRETVMNQMRKADLLALPTSGENFGHVIAEALSQSCPVMISTHTPWTTRIASGGGFQVQPNNPEAWSESISSLLIKGPKAWEKASERAAAAFHSWRSEDKGTHIFVLAAEKVKSI